MNIWSAHSRIYRVREKVKCFWTFVVHIKPLNESIDKDYLLFVSTSDRVSVWFGIENAVMQRAGYQEIVRLLYELKCVFVYKRVWPKFRNETFRFSSGQKCLDLLQAMFKSLISRHVLVKENCGSKKRMKDCCQTWTHTERTRDTLAW